MSLLIDVPETLLGKMGVKDPKTVVYVSYTLLIGIGVYLIVKKIKTIAAGRMTQAKQATTMANELSSISVNHFKTTISSGEAIIIAQNLLVAMDRYGSDEKAIFENLAKAKTGDDLLLITQKFGIKGYDGLGLSTGWISNTFDAVPKNLNGWLRSELAGNDLKKVKAIYDNLGVPF